MREVSTPEAPNVLFKFTKRLSLKISSPSKFDAPCVSRLSDSFRKYNFQIVCQNPFENGHRLVKYSNGSKFFDNLQYNG
jgi:hypothetical protein